MYKILMIAVLLVISLTVGAKSTSDSFKIRRALRYGDIEQAERLAKEVLKNSPNDVMANLALAAVCEEQENFAEQIVYLKRSLESDSKNIIAWNSLTMAYLFLGEVQKAEESAKHLEGMDEQPIKDTLNQLKMVKDELAHPDAVPVVSNVLDAAACIYRYNQSLEICPICIVKSVAAAEDVSRGCWKGRYLTIAPDNHRPIEFVVRVYPSGRVAIVHENRKVEIKRAIPMFTYYNYLRYFDFAKPDVNGIKSMELVEDDFTLMRLKGERRTIEVTLANLYDYGLAEFNAKIAAADRIVIRDGNFSWNQATDNDPVLYTIAGTKAVAEFNAMFAFVGKDERGKPLSIGLGCGCPGGPGIDWWKGETKLTQTALHHGEALWWDGFTWDFALTDKAKSSLAEWFKDKGIDLDKFDE